MKSDCKSHCTGIPTTRHTDVLQSEAARYNCIRTPLNKELTAWQAHHTGTTHSAVFSTNPHGFHKYLMPKPPRYCAFSSMHRPEIHSRTDFLQSKPKQGVAPYHIRMGHSGPYSCRPAYKFYICTSAPA